MLISYNGLLDLIYNNIINADVENVNSSSIDITLGNRLLVESQPFDPNNRVVDISDKDQCITTVEWFGANGEPFILLPGECVLASSMETFNLPNHISAEYKLKSSMARNFLEHLNAGWCDAGWHGSKLTLEFKNMNQYHALVIRPGMKIGQVVFFNHESVPDEKSYAVRGQYNGDQSVQKSKGVK